MTAMSSACWPRARLAEAVSELGRATHIAAELAAIDAVPPEPGEPWRLERWMERFAAGLGGELEACNASYREIDALVATAAPAIIGVDDDRFLVVLESGRYLTALAPGGERIRLRAREVARLLRERARAEIADALADDLEPLALGPRRLDRARDLLAGERLGQRPVVTAYLLRSPPSTRFFVELGREGVLSRAAIAVVGHLGFAAAWLASWAILGRGVFGGGLDPGWFAGWVLCLASMVVLRGVVSYSQTEAGIRFVTAVKRRLLAGAIGRDQDETAGEGISRNLAYVYESSALEVNGLRGLITVGLTGIELIVAPVLLLAGAGGWLHAAALLAWLGLAAYLSRHLVRARREWTEARFATSSRTLEAMLGQRTRRVQGRADELDRGDDRLLAEYAASGERLDRRKNALIALLARGWMVVGILTLAPAFLWGQWTTAELAISIGGVLFAYQALAALGRVVEQLASAAIAWEIIRPIFSAASRSEPAGIPEAMFLEHSESAALLEAEGLSYRYPNRVEPALEGTSLQIFDGDRVLLEGASGSGKSTLAQVISGLRQPESGGLSLCGLDFASVGASEWRRRVALVPQFHQNHILMGPLAFNLLLGRRWPPSWQDVADAYHLCVALGLGPLLEAMPSGIFQIVGQTGWRLSHGERSRVFLARALLQDADIVIVDESLSSLDPEHVERAARCLEERARALVLIAHP